MFKSIKLYFFWKYWLAEVAIWIPVYPNSKSKNVVCVEVECQTCPTTFSDDDFTSTCVQPNIAASRIKVLSKFSSLLVFVQAIKNQHFIISAHRFRIPNMNRENIKITVMLFIEVIISSLIYLCVCSARFRSGLFHLFLSVFLSATVGFSATTRMPAMLSNSSFPTTPSTTMEKAFSASRTNGNWESTDTISEKTMSAPFWVSPYQTWNELVNVFSKH